MCQGICRSKSRIFLSISYPQALAENYIQEAPNYSFPSITIPSDSYFVLGAHRNQSCDSHIWGFVPRENIIGKATNIFFPVGRAGAIQ
ncbi:MAG: S26 family signal peptidase [Cyanobacteriota bacterium]|nr:S26 family signal peptidase [Cyanobacteriota bacterium]